MDDKLKKVFKGKYVPENMQKYIAGEVNTYNMGNDYFYDWRELLNAMKKKYDFESDYIKRTIELLFKLDSYSAPEVYFSLFKKDKEAYIKSIEYLTDEVGLDLSVALYALLNYIGNIPVADLMEHFYKIDPNEVEKVLELYKSLGGTTYSGGFAVYYDNKLKEYLEVMKRLVKNQDDFKQRINKQRFYPISAFSGFMRFFDTDEEKLAYAKMHVTEYLNKRSVNQDIIAEINNFLDTGEKTKNFLKFTKMISTKNKAYVYDNDFTDFIRYRELSSDDLTDRRLVALSMEIDKYRTMEKLLFTCYGTLNKSSMKQEYIEDLMKNWKDITYDDVIDYLSYRMASSYYGLDANEYFNHYLNEDFDRLLKALPNISSKGLDAVIDSVHEKDKDKTIDFIFKNINLFKGKSLTEKAVNILAEEDNYDKLIEELNSKKSSVREIAVRSLIEMDKVTPKEELKSIFAKMKEKEKAKKLISLLSEYLGENATKEENTELYTKDAVLERAKNKKFQYKSDYSEYPGFVWKEDNTELPEEFTKHVMYLASRKDKKLLPSLELKAVMEKVTPESITRFMDSLEEYYLTTDHILRIMPFSKDDKYLDMLANYVQSLIFGYRGATAAKIVDVIASFKTTKAIQLLDYLSVKKNARDARVNRAAIAAMENIAKEMNLTKEDLLDFIIPDFGFDKEGKLILDFGPRQFTIALQNDLSFTVTDNKGKTFKNLPKPGKNDDKEKAESASKFFKSMKKDLKKQVAFERERLERGLADSRFWTGENWLNLFVNNPIMRQFALNLVWGKYDENGKLLQSFRYLEDGSFADIEDEEIKISANDKLGLVHPVELSEDELRAWKEIIEDYEIEQPFEQINRPVFMLEREGDEVIKDFQGYMLRRFTLRNNIFKFGWERGEVEDAGIFYSYFKRYPQGVIARLEFLGDYVGNYDDNEEVPLYSVYLSKNGDHISPGEISPRLYSELYYELKRLVEKGSGFNEKWEEVTW